MKNKPTITVFRIENEKGQGPYTNFNQVIGFGLNQTQLWIKSNHLDYRHPPIDVMPQDHICGFISMTQLQQWFSNTELETMKEYGFKVQTYETNQYITHTNQVTFLRPPNHISRNF